MTIRILGAHPLAVDREGRLLSRTGTLFPRSRTLVTLPGIHATQSIAYIADINATRLASGQPKLDEEDEMREWQNSVDLIMDSSGILIRPDPENMALAFEADELLQELVSKQKIKFLNLMNEKVRSGIKSRGENWRIASLPQTPDEMKRMIHASITPIGGKAIYYYSRDTGTRFISFQQFCNLGNLPDAELKSHLIEIRDYSGKYNRMAHPEVAFFAADKTFTHTRFSHALEGPIRTCYETLKDAFREAVPSELREDNIEDVQWRNMMFSALLGQHDKTIPEEVLLGLSPEFFMQIEWLPGGKIEEGELIFDSIFDELDRHPESPDLQMLCDEKARGFIFNFVREFGDIEYVNIGRVIGSLSRRPTSAGRRDVYVSEVKQANIDRPVVRISRMQKWGIREHLNEGKDLLPSIMEAEEYTEYILDRRLGCRQLGMNLPPRMTTRKISEHYRGTRYDGQLIWSTYFERDYLPGLASDKIPRSRFLNPAYCIKFAELLGKAAASSLIVGRMNLQNSVLFDDGDEVILENSSGFPTELIVSDHTGTFTDYFSPLDTFASSYAAPILRRIPFFPSPQAVIDAYLASFVERVLHIQQDYRLRKRAFDMLFKHRPRDERGSFAYRWERVLDRLNHTKPANLESSIRKEFTK
ncbi:MAG: hypothetical protein WCI03_09460 [bacterium]